ncbi:RNA polymerase II mediator complex subunit [Actinomortierella wolfii]|nr:RNA polymerase II mediator complex subunit [Actinomortierella wolfii]
MTSGYSPMSSQQQHPSQQQQQNHSTGNSAPLRRYVLHPPPKQKKLHKTSDLGYPGIFPQKPGQDEDMMTANNVKAGYIDKGVIQNETVSAQGILADVLQDTRKLQELGNFMAQVIKRKQENNRITGPSTFKPPSRSTLNELKKDQWMTDLAGRTSLRRLSRSVPHGFKSEKLLETLAQRQVPLLRATWYIKIVGLGEMQAQRSRQSQSQYSTDWTATVNLFLKKQLLEINPHSTTRPSPANALNSAAGGQSVKPWTSEEAKEKWEAKWRYSVMLTRWQYNEGLLDHRHFLRATVEQLTTLSFEQVALLLTLISMFLSEYARSRLLMRLLIDGLLNTLQAVQSHPSYNKKVFRYSYLELELKRMLQSIFLSTPDMFVIPKAWATHSKLMEEVILEDLQVGNQRPAHFPNVSKVLASHYNIIKARVQVFSENADPIVASGSDNDLAAAIEVLDNVDHLSDLEHVAYMYFSSTALPQEDTPTSSDGFTGTTCGFEAEECEAVAHLYGNLIHEGLFSYQQYLRRLIARGDLQARRRNEDSTLRHLKYLQTFPLYDPQPYHLNQRRVILFGVHEESEYEREYFESITSQIRAKLPYMFSAEAENMTFPVKDDQIADDELSMSIPLRLSEHLLTVSRFCQIQVTKEWLLKAVKSYVVKNVQIGEDNWRVMTSPGSSLLNARQLSTIVCIMEIATDYYSLYDMSTWLLEHTVDKGLLLIIINVLKKHRDVWASMGVLTRFSQAILNKHYSLQSKNLSVKALPRYLAFDASQVPEDIRLQMEGDVRSISKTLGMASNQPVGAIPQQIPELCSLIHNPNNISSQALSLCQRYGSIPQYPERLLDQVYDTLHKVSTLGFPSMSTSTSHHTGYGQASSSAQVFSFGHASGPVTLQQLVRVTRTLVGLLKETEEHLGRLSMNDTVVHWFKQNKDRISQQLSVATPSSTQLDPSMRHPIIGLENDRLVPVWFLSFVVQLVISGFCSIQAAVENICGITLAGVAYSVEAQLQQADQNGGEAPRLDEATLQLCMTMVLLLRLLLLEEDSDCCQSNHGQTSHGMRLTMNEIHHLQTARRFYLKSSERIQEQFQICKNLAWIESVLPLSHPVLHELQEYRKDWATTTEWIRELAFSKIDMTYKQVLSIIQDDTQDDPLGAGIEPKGDAHSPPTILHGRYSQTVRRKVIDTFRMLLVADEEEEKKILPFYSTTSPSSSYDDAAAEVSPEHINNCKESFRGLMRRVNHWILDRCKVELWILLNNVVQLAEKQDLLYGRSREKRNFFTRNHQHHLQPRRRNQRHHPHHGVGGTDKTDVDFGDMDMMVDDETDRAMLDSSGGTVVGAGGGGHDMLMMPGEEPDALEQVISIFFEEFVLSENADKELLGQLLSGLRKDVVEEFIRYGYGVLSGPKDSIFPYDSIVCRRAVPISDYSKIMVNFFYIMQVLMHESERSLGMTFPLDASSSNVGNGGGNSSQPGKPSQHGSSAAASPAVGSSGGGALTPGPRGDLTAPSPLPSQGLKEMDPQQKESGIEMVKSLLWQLGKFEEKVRVYDVMHVVGLSYEQAAQALENGGGTTGAGVDMYSLLLNSTTASGGTSSSGGMDNISYPDMTPKTPLFQTGLDTLYTPNSHSTLMSNASMMGLSSAGLQAQHLQSVELVHIRTSLCLRLRLLVPWLPFILQNPAECDLVTFVTRLTNLLVSSIVHGQGCEERLFEFCLDMVSFLMDEILLLSGGGGGSEGITKEMRNEVLNYLRTNLTTMVATVPTVFASRVFRIMPFQQHNVYFSNLRVANTTPGIGTGVVGNMATNVSTPSGVGAITKAGEIQPRPWDWLEDCVGDADIQQQQQQQAGGGGNGTGVGSSSSSGQGSQLSQQSSPGGSGMHGVSINYDGSSATPTLGGGGSTPGGSGGFAGSNLAGQGLQQQQEINANDTSISLTLFGAKLIRRDESGTTYERQFRLGAGGDEPQETLTVICDEASLQAAKEAEALEAAQQELQLQQQMQQKQQKNQKKEGGDRTDQEGDSSKLKAEEDVTMMDDAESSAIAALMDTEMAIARSHTGTPSASGSGGVVATPVTATAAAAAGITTTGSTPLSSNGGNGLLEAVDNGLIGGGGSSATSVSSTAVATAVPGAGSAADPDDIEEGQILNDMDLDPIFTSASSPFLSTPMTMTSGPPTGTGVNALPVSSTSSSSSSVTSSVTTTLFPMSLPSTASAATTTAAATSSTTGPAATTTLAASTSMESAVTTAPVIAVPKPNKKGRSKENTTNNSDSTVGAGTDISQGVGGDAKSNATSAISTATVSKGKKRGSTAATSENASVDTTANASTTATSATGAVAGAPATTTGTSKSNKTKAARTSKSTKASGGAATAKASTAPTSTATSAAVAVPLPPVPATNNLPASATTAVSSTGGMPMSAGTMMTGVGPIHVPGVPTAGLPHSQQQFPTVMQLPQAIPQQQQQQPMPSHQPQIAFTMPPQQQPQQQPQPQPIQLPGGGIGMALPTGVGMPQRMNFAFNGQPFHLPPGGMVNTTNLLQQQQQQQQHFVPQPHFQQQPPQQQLHLPPQQPQFMTFPGMQPQPLQLPNNVGDNGQVNNNLNNPNTIHLPGGGFISRPGFQ